jgi:hypothetical protein
MTSRLEPSQPNNPSPHRGRPPPRRGYRGGGYRCGGGGRGRGAPMAGPTSQTVPDVSNPGLGVRTGAPREPAHLDMAHRPFTSSSSSSSLPLPKARWGPPMPSRPPRPLSPRPQTCIEQDVCRRPPHEHESLVLSLAGPKKWFSLLFGTDDKKDEHVDEFLKSNGISKCGLHLEKFAAVISKRGYSLASFFDVNT